MNQPDRPAAIARPPLAAGGRARLVLLLVATGLALALAATALAPAPASAAALPRGFVGMQSWEPMNGPQLSLIGKSNMGTYRRVLLWHKVEPIKPTGDCSRSCTHAPYRWAYYDDLFRRAALRGVRFVPVLIGSPRWSGARKPQVQPTTASGKAAFRQFAEAAARRYGPNGTLWRKHPWSASSPAPAAVRGYYWQVWNEPNIKNYWLPEPNAAQYGAMLRGVSASLKRASSQVRVVSAGLPWPAEGVRADTYLYRLLGVSGVRAAVDVFAIHPYARQVSMPGQEDVMDRIAQARNVLVSRGAGDKSMWITEIGWASGTPDGRFTVTERQQRDNLDELYRRVLSIRRSYRLLGAIWFSFKDERTQPGHAGYWGLNSGLFYSGGMRYPKPSWHRLRYRALNGY